MNGFERRKLQKQESIRQAATRLFLDNGVEKVTIQEIAAEAGVSYATIFKYFRSKQDLVLDVVRWGYERAYDQLEVIVKSDKPYLERIQDMMFHKGYSIDSVNLDLFKRANAYDPREIARIDATYEEKKKRLYTEFFREGKQKGYICPDVSIDAIMLHRKGLRALVLADPQILAEFKHNRGLLKGYMRILLFGIMGKKEFPDGPAGH